MGLPRVTPDQGFRGVPGAAGALLDLEQSWGRGVKCSCSRFGAVLDDEQKVAGKRTCLTAVVAVVI